MVRSTKVANDRHKPYFNPQTHELGEDMQVGTLVRRKDTIDPRIGIVDWLQDDGSGLVLTRVLWNTGQTGHYYAKHLEALCK